MKHALQQTGKSYAAAAAEIGCSKPMLVAVVCHARWPKKGADELRRKIKEFFKRNGADIPAGLDNKPEAAPAPNLKSKDDEMLLRKETLTQETRRHFGLVRDIEFLARLTKEYGHSFKIVGDTLVFAANEDLAERKPVAVLNPADIIRLRLRDLIKGVPTEAVVSGYDAKNKRNVQTRRKAKPRRSKAKRGSSGDTLKITANRGETAAQIRARADAALADAQNEQCAGNITLFGHAKLVAGQTVELQNHGKFSGKYLVKQARHELRRRTGYTTELEIKMLEYIPETPSPSGDKSEKPENDRAPS